MEGPVSERLVDQRLRNRVMEALWWLEEGPDGRGADEYIEQFYDQMDGDAPRSNSAMNEEEAGAVAHVCRLMNQLCDETPQDVSEEDLVRTGWLSRIQSEARNALAVFLKRGRFIEDIEAAKPSFEAGQAWYMTK